MNLVNFGRKKKRGKKTKIWLITARKDLNHQLIKKWKFSQKTDSLVVHLGKEMKNNDEINYGKKMREREGGRRKSSIKRVMKWDCVNNFSLLKLSLEYGREGYENFQAFQVMN